MTDVMELTKADIIALIDETDVEIAEVKNTEPKASIPTHDFYRGVMFGQCISCGNRFVDNEGCAVCKPAKAFLQKYREDYPWKSDNIRK